MDIELEQRAPEKAAGSNGLDEAHGLLVPNDTDETKRLKDEATCILHEKYAKLADMDVVDILKVVGNVNIWAPHAQQEITELCISIAFPPVILQCRSLANLLASLSTFDDHGRVPDIAWYWQQHSMLGRLSQGFVSDYTWKARWSDVFERWQREAEDSSWLSAKVSSMRNHLDDIRPIFISIEEAFGQITAKTGIYFGDITRNIRETFQMFGNRLAECSAKADELMVKERSKHLSPSSNVGRVQSWASGADTSSSGAVQRAPFGKGAATPGMQPETSPNGMFQKLRDKVHKRPDIDPNMGDQHWTGLFEFAKSPVLLILAAAMPFTIYSTLLCETPDDLPVVDSNFWSTLSQCVSGFAGLYVVTKPMFSSNAKDKIKTAFPKTFYTMLVLSLATSIVSAIAYAWSPPASIPLAYVSGLALNIATLLIIQDSGNQIKETNRLNEGLAVEVTDLEMELAGYRARGR